MKKIAIITIQDNNNYGNRLQNYAMQEILRSMNYDVSTLKNRVRTNSPNSQIKENVVRFLKFIQELIKNACIHKRYLCFKNFNKNIIYGKYISFCNAKKIKKEYDLFVTGSDQVWNINYFKSMYIFMLGFANKSQKIAIAPSISVNHLEFEQIMEMKKFIYDFDYLSIREKSGKEILLKNFNLDSEVLIDPTLMLSTKQWSELAKQAKRKNNNPYLLIYLLGGMNEKYKKYIFSISKKYKLEIVNLLDKNGEFYNTGPSEFLFLIKNSRLIFTDSFHCSIFSYIFNRPLRIMPRLNSKISIDSRLTNLVRTLKIDESVFYGKSSENIDFDIKYDKTELIIEQRKFMTYLSSVLTKNYENDEEL